MTEIIDTDEAQQSLKDLSQRYAYSASTNAFYYVPDKASYISWPDDAIDVEESVFHEFAGHNPPEGKVRAGNDKGMPAWVDAQKPTKEQYIARADVMKAGLMNEAGDKISPLQDAVDMDMATEEETALLTAWKKYRVLLNRIDTSKAPDITWPGRPE